MREETLGNLYSEKVLPYYSMAFDQCVITGFRGIGLHCISQSNVTSPVAMLILGGRTEFALKYAEILYDLRHLNITFFSFDHRGQGMSQRLLKDHMKGHVESFDDYVEDLKIILDDLIGTRYEKIIVLGQSLGGAVAARFQQQYPGYLNGMILSAPMFGINCFPVPRYVARWISQYEISTGAGDRYIVGGGPYSGPPRFINNVFTSCRARFDLNQGLIKENPALALGSPTYRWLYESLISIDEIVERAEEIDIPVLILQSGRDRVVTAEEQVSFANKAGNCRLVEIKEARHELLMETDDLRKQALGQIQSFLLEQGVAANSIG